MVELLAQRAIRVKSGRTERRRNIMRALVLHHHGTVTARCAQRQYVELLARTAHGEAGFRTRMAFDLTGREEAPGVQGEGRGRDSSHTGDRRRGRSLMRRPAVGVVYGQALCTPERSEPDRAWRHKGTDPVWEPLARFGRFLCAKEHGPARPRHLRICPSSPPPPPPGLAGEAPPLFI